MPGAPPFLRSRNSIAVRDTRHSYAVLRGLTSAGGGMVAAATTSLPERADLGRDYDYRYVWIRDQCYAGQAVAVDGPHHCSTTRSVSWRNACSRTDPTCDPPTQSTAARCPTNVGCELPGYPGGADTVGNHANGQFQLDAFGEALLLFAAAARYDHLDAQTYRAVPPRRRHRPALAAPDAGIWELDNRHWTHSRLTCVAGLRAVAAQIPAPDGAAFGTRWPTPCGRTATDSQHASGRWQRAPDDPRVDAALLVPGDPRGAARRGSAQHRHAARGDRANSSEDGYVYRFRHDDRPLAEAEGAFLLCGFWTALAHHQQGDIVSAVRYFERNRAACGPPGLLARNTTSRNANCAATSPRRSCTPCSSKPLYAWPPTAPRRSLARRRRCLGGRAGKGAVMTAAAAGAALTAGSAAWTRRRH